MGHLVLTRSVSLRPLQANLTGTRGLTKQDQRAGGAGRVGRLIGGERRVWVPWREWR